jgi:hypothetical protein
MALVLRAAFINIHRTIGAVTGSGSSRRARRPHAAWTLFGCGPASASRYPYGGPAEETLISAGLNSHEALHSHAAG